MNDADVAPLESEEYNNAVLILLDDFSNVTQRLGALRVLYKLIQDGVIIDPYNRKKINQLILDNVMHIMLEDASSTNSFKQQLIRVELFTLLSHILRAENLFGNDVTTALQKHAESLVSRSESPQKVSRDTESKGSKSTKTSRQWVPSSSSGNAASVTSPPLFGRARLLNKKKSTKMLTSSSSVGSITSDISGVSHSIVKDVLSQLPKTRNVELSSKLKPRAAVLFNDNLSKESFVPGVDPTNFIEQDRKLGYQKPRMWFPTPMMALAKDGLETATAKSSGPSQIVEEYLRMRALATYVGDAVVPLSGTLSKYLPSTSILDPVTLANGKTAPIDALRYKNAVREVMDMWTPILSAHRPPNGKRPQFSYLRSQQDPPPPPVKERKVHEEYVSFEDDDDDEDSPYHDPRSQRLSQKMKYLRYVAHRSHQFYAMKHHQ